MQSVVLDRRSLITAIKQYIVRENLAPSSARKLRVTIRKGGCIVSFETECVPSAIPELSDIPPSIDAAPVEPLLCC